MFAVHVCALLEGTTTPKLKRARDVPRRWRSKTVDRVRLFSKPLPLLSPSAVQTQKIVIPPATRRRRIPMGSLVASLLITSAAFPDPCSNHQAKLGIEFSQWLRRGLSGNDVRWVNRSPRAWLRSQKKRPRPPAVRSHYHYWKENLQPWLRSSGGSGSLRGNAMWSFLTNCHRRRARHRTTSGMKPKDLSNLTANKLKFIEPIYARLVNEFP